MAPGAPTVARFIALLREGVDDNSKLHLDHLFNVALVRKADEIKASLGLRLGGSRLSHALEESSFDELRLLWATKIAKRHAEHAEEAAKLSPAEYLAIIMSFERDYLLWAPLVALSALPMEPLSPEECFNVASSLQTAHAAEIKLRHVFVEHAHKLVSQHCAVLRFLAE